MVSVQNRTDLYAKLPAEGIHSAELVAVEVFSNTFGDRVGLVFRLADGTELMQSAAPGSPRGKLAELLRGLGGAEGTLAAAQAAVGRQCRVAIRHGSTKAGNVYAGIDKTY
jgi:hypothetical protein